MDYHIRVIVDWTEVDARGWDRLVDASGAPPFLRHAFVDALHGCGCASAASGWQPLVLALERGPGRELAAACLLYAKSHSYGEYVFDWAWAQAYARHGLDYYPKLLAAIPFTPVPAPKLLASSDDARAALLDALLDFARRHGAAGQISSLHLLFLTDTEARAAQDRGMLLRSTVQFHWRNRAPAPYADFDDFLAALQQAKRKKIRQEERHVAAAGIGFRLLEGAAIGPALWDFFYDCYERTYLEHGNPPYLSRAFFQRVGRDLPEMWLLVLAERAGKPVAASLVALDRRARRAYGRYWGMAPGEPTVPLLHFAACYYQPLRWCVEQRYTAYEGGAQGRHKLARGLEPVRTTSAHWLADARFADAVARHLQAEGREVDEVLDELADHAPFKAQTG